MVAVAVGVASRAGGRPYGHSLMAGRHDARVASIIPTPPFPDIMDVSASRTGVPASRLSIFLSPNSGLAPQAMYMPPLRG